MATQKDTQPAKDASDDSLQGVVTGSYAPRHRLRWAGLAIVVVAIGGTSFWLLQNDTPQAPPQPQAQTVQVSEDNLAKSLEADVETFSDNMQRFDQPGYDDGQLSDAALADNSLF